jgi:hypothetical protein
MTLSKGGDSSRWYGVGGEGGEGGGTEGVCEEFKR